MLICSLRKIVKRKLKQLRNLDILKKPNGPMPKIRKAGTGKVLRGEVVGREVIITDADERKHEVTKVHRQLLEAGEEPAGSHFQRRRLTVAERTSGGT